MDGTWKKYGSVTELPPYLWDQTVARGEVALDSRLVRAAERVFSDAWFEYWIRERDGNVSALVLWMIEENTASTGTPETTGLHFWFDESVLGKDAFLEEAAALCGETIPTIVFRDFIGENTVEWQALFQKKGYEREQALDLSVLSVPEHIRTLEEYPSVLNSKHRYRWNQYRAAIDPNLYEVETVTDFLPLLDKLYPLYVEVSERSEEYEAKPYSKDYFRIVKEEFGDDAAAVVIREKSTGQYLGFMLLLYGHGSCVHQYIGFHKREELFLWHNLTIESIGDAIRRGIRRINMGVTHATAKRKFGAVNQNVFIFTHKRTNE